MARRRLGRGQPFGGEMRDVVEPYLFAVGSRDALHGDVGDALDRKLSGVTLAGETDRGGPRRQAMRHERRETGERAARLRRENLLERRALGVVGPFVDVR